MKKFSYILTALLAVLTLASCSKDEKKSDPEPEPEPVEKTVTLATVINGQLWNGTPDFSQFGPLLKAVLEKDIPSEYGTVSVTYEVATFNVTISARESNLSALISKLNDATGDIREAVDKSTNLLGLTFTLQHSVDYTTKKDYTFTYTTTMYSPEGNWRTQTEDGLTCTLFVKEKDGEYQAAMTYNGLYRLGKVEYDGKKTCLFTATDSLSKTWPLEMQWYFDGGNKDGFQGKLTYGSESECTKYTFKKIDIGDEEVNHFEYTLVDPDNELPAILGDSLEAFKTAVKSGSVTLKEKDYQDKYGLWKAIFIYTWDIIHKESSATIHYMTKYPAIRKTNAYIQMDDYAIITDGTFPLHSVKLYFNLDNYKKKDYYVFGE